MRIVLVAAAAACVAAVAAHTAEATPGPKCGGTLWKQLTLADNGKGVDWNPKTTTVADIAKLTAPARVTASRTTGFQKQVWKLDDVVIERYHAASNGELVFELYDVPSNTYMNAYVPATSCMSANKTLRAAMTKARNAFVGTCPKATPEWQILGAHAVLLGVGFWNPVKTTEGALQNGAELRPLVGLTITQGCGK